MPGDDRLPNLQIIGAAKCGTSSLHHYLGLHPQICMSEPKETFFLERDDYGEALDEYRRCFAASADVRGEASTSYSQYPRVKHIPERIHSLDPRTKLVYLVRDPIDRAESCYQQRVAMRVERSSIEDAFADLEDDYNIYTCQSRYALQLERYLEHFPLEQIMVVDNVDLATRREETLRSIFAFLDVDDGFESERFSERLNTGEGKLGMTGAGTALRESRLAAVGRKLLPAAMREPAYAALRRGLSRQVAKVPLPDDIRERLAAALRDDAARLRVLTGRRFEHWSV